MSPKPSDKAYSIDVDLATQLVSASSPSFGVELSTDTPGVELGVPGLTGPPGPTGLVKVEHGADPNVARPDAPLVYWVGTVQPLNADPDDLLMLKEL